MLNLLGIYTVYKAVISMFVRPYIVCHCECKVDVDIHMSLGRLFFAPSLLPVRTR